MSTYAYIRVSTLLQSKSSQEYEIRKYCRKHNVQIDRWVVESVSGTVVAEKRALGHIMAEMRRGDLLVCTELSRLGRSMLMIMGILNQCALKGISIHTIKDGFDLNDSINSKIIAFAFALAAEIERSLISQRTREALAAKKMAGVRLGRPPGNSRQKEVIIRNLEGIRDGIREGRSITEMATELGVHRNTLRKHLNKLPVR